MEIVCDFILIYQYFLNFLVPYYLLTFNFLVGADSDTISLKELLHAKIEKKKEADSSGTQP
jgi:hypothetical protein